MQWGHYVKQSQSGYDKITFSPAESNPLTKGIGFPINSGFQHVTACLPFDNLYFRHLLMLFYSYFAAVSQQQPLVLILTAETIKIIFFNSFLSYSVFYIHRLLLFFFSFLFILSHITPQSFLSEVSGSSVWFSIRPVERCWKQGPCCPDWLLLTFGVNLPAVHFCPLPSDTFLLHCFSSFPLLFPLFYINSMLFFLFFYFFYSLHFSQFQQNPQTTFDFFPLLPPIVILNLWTCFAS